MSPNPIFSTDLPFGLPDFAAATASDYRAALEQSMADQLRGLTALKENQAEPTVENVIGAWEDADATGRRARNAFFAVYWSDATDELEQIWKEFAPKLAEHNDAIFLDQALFSRLQALQERIEAGLTPADEQDRYALSELLRRFTRAGVALAEADQNRLRELNKKLAELNSHFESLNRAARNAGGFNVTEAELAGLSDEERSALANDGSYRIELVNTTQQPLGAKLSNADVRRKLHEASTRRALSGEFDTRATIIEIARTRAERAQLLGYPHPAALVAEAGCAKTTDAILEMLVPLAQAALRRAREEAVELAAYYETLNPGAPFSAADWAFVEAQVRREKFDFDEAELAQYLAVEDVVKHVFAAAEELYGITFVRREDLVGHVPDARVYEVREADGSVLGLYMLDLWARPTKNGGAWMSSIVDQSHRDGTLPVVTNNCNYSHTTPVVSWDEVNTMFHEFGHALHGLLADSKYASFSGTSTPRDFVEFPSQVNEHWAWTPGRVLPESWLNKLAAANAFGQGYATAEVELSSLLDLVWHMTPIDELPASPEEVEAFEQQALAKYDLVEPLVPPRYRSSYFAHIWGGGYAASYYGYAWAKVMDADAVAWFDSYPGSLREAGEHFRRTLLAPGGSVDALETYRAFRGRDPELQPLLDRLGLVLTQ